MQEITVAQLVLLGLSVLAAVGSAWFARSNNVKRVRDDVDELLGAVEKIGRYTRSEQMRRVRQASDDYAVPPELKAAPSNAPIDIKSQLRARARGIK